MSDPHASPESIVTAYHQAWIDRSWDGMVACVVPDLVEKFTAGFKSEFDDSQLEGFELGEVEVEGDAGRVSVSITFMGVTGRDGSRVRKVDGKWYVG